MRLARLCKGSTADSDSVCEGSNPSLAATKHQLKDWCFFLFHFAHDKKPVTDVTGFLCFQSAAAGNFIERVGRVLRLPPRIKKMSYSGRLLTCSR